MTRQTRILPVSQECCPTRKHITRQARILATRQKICQKGKNLLARQGKTAQNCSLPSQWALMLILSPHVNSILELAGECFDDTRYNFRKFILGVSPEELLGRVSGFGPGDKCFVFCLFCICICICICICYFCICICICMQPTTWWHEWGACEGVAQLLPTSPGRPPAWR